MPTTSLSPVPLPARVERGFVPGVEWAATVLRVLADKAEPTWGGEQRAYAMKYAAALIADTVRDLAPQGGDDAGFQADPDFAQREIDALGKNAREGRLGLGLASRL